MKKTSLPLVTVTPLEEKKVAFQRISAAQPILPPDCFKWSLDLVLVALQYYVYVTDGNVVPFLAVARMMRTS